MTFGSVDFTQQKIMSRYRLLKTGCNNVVGATFFLVVYNIVELACNWA